MYYDASGKLLLEHHGNGIGTQNRYHSTRGFLESSRKLRWTTNAHLQEYEMQLDDLGNVLWRREARFAGTPDGQPHFDNRTNACRSICTRQFPKACRVSPRSLM